QTGWPTSVIVGFALGSGALLVVALAVTRGARWPKMKAPPPPSAWVIARAGAPDEPLIEVTAHRVRLSRKPRVEMRVVSSDPEAADWLAVVEHAMQHGRPPPLLTGGFVDPPFDRSPKVLADFFASLRAHVPALCAYGKGYVP